MGRPVVPIRQLDRRLPELGRIKDGKKRPNGAPKAIDTLRFTSQDPKALEQIAATLGGEVVPYSDPKSTDTHELITPVAECPVILPPDPLGGTPMYELYSGGGRERWCDGADDAMIAAGKGDGCEQWRKGSDGPEPFYTPCLCYEAGELSCKPVVHLSVILPFARLGGTWRWTTHSYNAAVELPGMVEAIQAMQAKGLTRGVLRVDSRTQRLAGVTRNFKVPVLGVDATADELASGQATLGAGSPSPVSSVEGGAARQALPSGSAGGPPAGNDGTGGEAADTQAAPGAVENATGGEGSGYREERPQADHDGSEIGAPTPSGGVTADQLRQAVHTAHPDRDTARKQEITAAKTAATVAGALSIEFAGGFDDIVADQQLAAAVLADLAGDDKPPPPGGSGPAVGEQPHPPEAPASGTAAAEPAPTADPPSLKAENAADWRKENARCQALAAEHLSADPETLKSQREALAYQASGGQVTSWADLTRTAFSQVRSWLEFIAGGHGRLVESDRPEHFGWRVEIEEAA